MKEVDAWRSKLALILGEPIKDVGCRPSKDHIKITEKYGGIWANQTLYMKNFGEYSVVAMFWPWSDNMYVTLKISKE